MIVLVKLNFLILFQIRTFIIFVISIIYTNGNGKRIIMKYEIGVIIIYILSMLIPNAIYVLIELRKKKKTSQGK
jgi:uncharacterized membrane protein